MINFKATCTFKKRSLKLKPQTPEPREIDTTVHYHKQFNTIIFNWMCNILFVIRSEVGLLELLSLESLFVGLTSVDTLDSEVTTSPSSKKFDVIIVVGFEAPGLRNH